MALRLRDPDGWSQFRGQHTFVYVNYALVHLLQVLVTTVVEFAGIGVALDNGTFGVQAAW